MYVLVTAVKECKTFLMDIFTVIMLRKNIYFTHVIVIMTTMPVLSGRDYRFLDEDDCLFKMCVKI